ncbi:helix-turn-helix transcriptional regulator [Oceanicaulis sp. MMSF_3324]|uniref:helix-turn-helix transcriptional regulator n=1 Tax=Oceanicaulis sp. MMSF_3324 TaxID=3046702 RepID=UPI00273DDF4E|nr:helix-turn-helix transcriptional regulator [Oceanicaulis sp. MMSF_3324]
MSGAELGNAMKALRAQAGMTQAELAAAVGVTRKTINTVENGVFIPSALLALKIAKALDHPVDQVFWLQEDM